MTTYNLEYLDKKHKVELVKTKYFVNDTTAIFVNTITEEGIEPFGQVSTNLCLPCNKDEIYVKEANDKYGWEEDFLIKNKIATKLKNTRIQYNYNIYNKFKLN